MIRPLAALLAFLVAAPAFGQTPIMQSGKISPGHIPVFQTNGVASDGGGAAAGNVREVGITNTGLPLCINSAPVSSPGGYYQDCWGASASGSGLLTHNAYGGASQTPFNFNINGNNYAFPGNGNGNIMGPNASTLNTVATWNNTGGTLLKDTGAVVAGVTSGMGVTGPTAWDSGTTIYDGFRISVNGYPVSSEFGNNAINLTQAIVGAVNVPSNATNGFSAASYGVAGYGVSSSANEGAVGTFGFGGSHATNAEAWGMNALVTNCPSPNCATNTGYQSQTLWGIEVDANVMKSGGVAPPNLIVYGIDIIGASETQVGSGGASYAAIIQPLGIGSSPAIPWNIALLSSDAAAQVALYAGATCAAGGTCGSQPIDFNAFDGTITPILSYISETSGGILQLQGATFLNIGAAGNTAVAQASSTSFALLAPSTGASTPSVPLDFQAYNNAASMLAGDIQLIPRSAVADMVINSASGRVILESGGVGLFTVDPAVPAQFQIAADWTANATTATTMTSLGPAGAHTTVQKWLTVLDDGGVTRYIPAY